MVLNLSVNGYAKSTVLTNHSVKSLYTVAAAQLAAGGGGGGEGGGPPIKIGGGL